MAVESYKVPVQIHDKKPKFWYQDMNMSWDDFADHCIDDDKVCDDCGCSEMEEEISKWHKVNGGEYCSDAERDPYYWCPYCGDSDGSIEKFSIWIKEHVSKFFTKGVK